MEMVGGLLQKLRPGVLDDLGIEAALQDLIETWQSRHKDVACKIDIVGIKENLNEAQSITLYRLVQESLTNITKHANATEMSVQLLYKQKNEINGIQAIVKDNGKGFKQETNSGFGLPGMRERIEGLGGELIIKPNLGKGTEINAWIPFKA